MPADRGPPDAGPPDEPGGRHADDETHHFDVGVGEILERVAEQIQRAAGCDDVFSYEWVRYGRQIRFAEVHAVGDPTFCAITAGLEGRSAFDYLGPTEPPREAWPGELWPLDRFALVRAPAIRHRGAYALHWSPAGITCSLGLNITDGDAVVGGICAVRRAGDPPLSRAQLRAVRQIEARIRAAFVAACRLRVRLAGHPGARSVLAFDPDGRALAASPDNAGWIGSPQTQRRLSHIAQQITCEGTDRSAQFVRRAPARLERLVGRLPLVVAWVTEGDRYRPGARERLTPTQRRVADLVVLGATVDEIAHALDRRPNTVRHHLKGVYERLGIGSRAELAGLLEPPPPDGDEPLFAA